MIFVGYQGIGKSTLANAKSGYIDLESGNFWIDGERDKYWYKPYCKIAHHLSEQGYDVFISSHEVVRTELKKYECDKAIICPSVELKTEWISKLTNRYNTTGLDKDYKAMMNAINRYEENIFELLSEEGFNHILIKSINYDLSTLINEYS